MRATEDKKKKKLSKRRGIGKKLGNFAGPKLPYQGDTGSGAT